MKKKLTAIAMVIALIGSMAVSSFADELPEMMQSDNLQTEAQGTVFAEDITGEESENQEIAESQEVILSEKAEDTESETSAEIEEAQINEETEDRENEASVEIEEAQVNEEAEDMTSVTDEGETEAAEDTGNIPDVEVMAEGEIGEEEPAPGPVPEKSIEEAPTITNAEAGISGIRIFWNAVEDVRGYQIYRKAEGEEDYTYVGASFTTNWKDEEAVFNTSYRYRVRAYFVTESGKVVTGPLCDSVQAGMVPNTDRISAVRVLNGIKLQWNAASGVRGYQVYRKAQGESDYTLIATTQTASFIDTAAVNNTYYSYLVRAYNKASNGYVYYGAFSGEVSAGYISQVLNLSVTAAANGLNISWKEIPGVRGYQVYRKKAGEQSFTRVAASIRTTWADTGAESNTEYVYMVRAYNTNAGGKVYYGAFSIEKKGIFLAQVTGTAVKQKINGLNSSWNPVKGASGYQIYRAAENESSYTLVGTSVTASWTDTSVKSNVVYSYKVRAYNKDDAGRVLYGAFGNVVTSGYIAQVRITNVTADKSGVTLNWTEINGADGYQVYRKGPSETGYTWMTATQSLNWTDNDTVKDQVYSYMVRAYKNMPSGGFYVGVFSAASEVTGPAKLTPAEEHAVQVNNQLGNSLYNAFIYASQYPYAHHDVYVTTSLIWPEIPSVCFEHYSAYGYGDCFCMASTFYMLAKTMGYNAHMVYGQVPSRQGGMTPHCWVEIDYDWSTIVYDPQFHNQYGYGGYEFYYGQSGTWMYSYYSRVN